jgi:hypothetical protein
MSIIAFITSYARIHPHRHLLSKIHYVTLLYCDSDSMCMVCNKGPPDSFETSKLLTGYFKLEHTGMTEWYSLAPKMYAMSAGYAYALGSSSAYAMSEDESADNV